MSNTRLLVVHALSPLHVGIGQSTSAVDLPIARDRATGFPLLPGSSLKGALRSRARENGTLKATWLHAFGPETENASLYAGAVAISDARLLLMPVRSVAGTFAWVTSPYLLASFEREAKLAGIINLAKLPKVDNPGCALVTKETCLSIEIGKVQKVVLEDFDLDRHFGADELAASLAPSLFAEPEWQKIFAKRLCIVNDDTMSFLCQHATDIVTRVSIDPETGTAKNGQLWTEENLPAESVLISLVEENRVYSEDKGGHLDRISKEILNKPIQLGGKATVGRGRCALRFVPMGGN